jgi:hypothetical protein
MAYDIPGFSFTGIAAADLTGKEGYGVVIDTAGKIALAGAGVAIDGILRYASTAGQAVTVVKSGQMGVVFGGSVTAGANLSTDAAGKFVVTAAPAIVAAKAREAGSAGERHAAMLGDGQHSAVDVILSFPIKLAKLADGDIVTDYIPGFAGTVRSVKFVVTDPATTAAKASALHVEIEATAVTGGVLSLTSANCTPLGKSTAATAITALNTFTSSEKLSVVAAATTAFVEGEGVLLIVLGQ